MGCKSFHSGNTTIRFNENNDDVSCLCTFPHNYEECGIGGRLTRSLAYLGAMVVLSRQGAVFGDVTTPEDLPTWIKEGIDNSIKL